MKYRKLRIAFSVTCGIACVLLVVLWVRSYWWKDSLYINYYGGTDRITYTDVKSLRFFSTHGRIGISNRQMRWAPRIVLIRSRVSQPYREYQDDLGQTSTSAWFRLMHWRGFSELLVPYWGIVLTSGVLAAAPWIWWSRRFSLRTLLIATTLIAVVLGLIVYASR